MVAAGVDGAWPWLPLTGGVASSCWVLLPPAARLLPSLPTSGFSPGLSGTGLAKGFGEPSTEGFSLNSDLAAWGGDEPVTVRVGGGKKEEPAAGRRGPPSLPDAPREEGLSTPLEVTLEPVSVWEDSREGARMGRCSQDSVEPQEA